MIATNAEIGSETATLRRLRQRMAVIPAYAVVTEPIAADRMIRILPGQGPVSDTFLAVRAYALRDRLFG